MAIDTKLVDELLAEYGHRPQDLLGDKGLLKQMTKALAAEIACETARRSATKDLF